MRIRVNNALFSTVSAVVLSLSAVTAVYAYEAPDVAPEQVSELDTLIVTRAASRGPCWTQPSRGRLQRR
ncbi:hypothetical protein [Caulobacter sp. B11]|uniref:hypothetical protein n=1 Tax=Caulobacter sp. B11 TaxID=2048899 RepID=UPI00117CF821|nr:hypothetical protein [Caulobacter sp. B11]